jgi:hypothetical protein
MDGRVFVQFTQHQLIIGTVVTKSQNIIFSSHDEFDRVRVGLDLEDVKQRLGLFGSQSISYRLVKATDATSDLTWRNF